MKRLTPIFILLLLCPLCGTGNLCAEVVQPRSIARLLDRIGGKGTSRRILTVLDEGAVPPEQGRPVAATKTPSPAGPSVTEYFCLSSRSGKPLIRGNSLTAIGAGINWYLNHYAHVQLSWDALTTDLSQVRLPLPPQEEWHCSQADYRYYLNYCTFGYSMSTWTWERWEKEIDWMALHGINMPLQLVGLEAVWRDFLMQDCHYTRQQAENFIPGPAYTAWWGMNNLEGWAGTHLNAWYERQARLGKRICERERELGMMPVLPGFSGMVPSQFEQVTGIPTERANLWCQFQRPAILDPTSPHFARLAACYYRHLQQVMGHSIYYSMDPFHEGGTISSGRYEEGYRAVFDAMQAHAGDQSRWIIQQWQWAPYQATSLRAVPPGRLLVLDLYSDGQPAFDAYAGYAPQQAIYCVIPNFGGRTGLMGRLPRIAEGWKHYHDTYATVRGIGSAPEAIESVPVVYDLLYELPWMDRQPDMKTWIKDYALNRYGQYCPEAEQAWTGLLQTVLSCPTALQGPHESTMCARPSLQVDRVSSWGGTALFYPSDELVSSCASLLEASRHIGTTGSLGARHMAYDLTDLLRQCLSDYSLELLGQTRQAYQAVSSAATPSESALQHLKALQERFLGLLLDTDRLLATQPLFRLGHWTEQARLIAREVTPLLSRADRALLGGNYEEQIADWLEYDNARTLITTWGDLPNSEQGGLHDYSYRQWQGLLSDFYYPRWKHFFDHLSPTDASSGQTPSSFFSEWNWAHAQDTPWDASAKGTVRQAHPQRYSPTPEGDILTIANELFHTYF